VTGWLHHFSSVSGTLPTATAMLSSLLLLFVRAWMGLAGPVVSRRVSVGLDAVIAVDGLAFLFFVLVRFVNLG
jgi:hypothetical protein